ncbi:type 1 glutamine amidotransferase [Terrihabitans rhizophilus]|uniref:Type 1 glutamine amidotransferase n=1 Tax=Terrihabitans rhizophilus TaxID=3092662 RepID=A0ABU4RMB1_9HYPH|nr:type 1 glutamine amidotransferase [Terrihabitans sp. PJ23]MDX6804810.1 type 1 glutamine amidotransferase [Terrihabitans sp. PJ23]
MNVLAVENFPGTHLGLIGPALDEGGIEVDLRCMHAGAALPLGHAGYDGLVILGGDQSALADDTHPYLPALARLAVQFADADKAVLGVCLGSQILARGFGGRNILDRPIEIGWQTVTATHAGRADPVISALGDGAPLFHWHRDTFDLPGEAIRLASSAQTPNQAFRVGRAAYGLQFHFEADRALVAQWLEAYRAMLDRDAPEFVQRHAEQEGTLGVEADRVGLEIARRWVALL